MKIEPHERHSPMWLAMVDHMEKRLDALRRQNDSVLEASETAMLRGRIAEVKAFLALAEVRQNQPT